MKTFFGAVLLFQLILIEDLFFPVCEDLDFYFPDSESVCFSDEKLQFPEVMLQCLTLFPRTDPSV